MDKIRRFGYNIENRADAIIRSPPRSPFPYDIDRDNFFPSFVALGAIWVHPLLYRSIWRRGNALVGYAQYERWDGSYVIRLGLWLMSCVRDHATGLCDAIRCDFDWMVSSLSWL